MSQTEVVLAELLKGGWLSTLDIFRLSGSLAARSRIDDIRKLGYVTETRRTTVNGRAVWSYRLVGPRQRELFAGTMAALESLTSRGHEKEPSLERS